MARERHLKSIEIADIPELLRIVRQLQSSDEPLVLKEESRDVAIVHPLKGPRRARLPRGKALSENDSLWKLVGSATSASPTDASKKHEYLTEAYKPHQA